VQFDRIEREAAELSLPTTARRCARIARHPSWIDGAYPVPAGLPRRSTPSTAP